MPYFRKILFILLIITSLIIKAEGSFSLEWEFNRDYGSEEVKTNDLSKVLELTYEYDLSNNFQTEFDLSSYISSSYNSQSLGIGADFESGKFNLQPAFSIAKYSYADSSDYLDKGLLFYAYRDISRGSFSLDLSINSYDYLEKTTSDYTYQNLGVTVTKEKGERIEHSANLTVTAQKGSLDFSSDYRNYSASYNYYNSINDYLSSSAQIDFNKQKEKDPDTSDYHEITYGGDLTWAKERYYLILTESVTEHNKAFPQVYDSDYILLQTYFYAEYELSDMFSISMDVTNYSEDHDETPADTEDVINYIESFNQFSIGFTLDFNLEPFSSTLTLYLDEIEYPSIPGFEDSTDQKSRTITWDLVYEPNDIIEVGLTLERDNLTYGDGEYSKYRNIELELSYSF